MSISLDVQLEADRVWLIITFLISKMSKSTHDLKAHRDSG